MTKLIVLKFDGNFALGFRVTLEISVEGERPEVEIIGNLPSCNEIVEKYNTWKSSYCSLGKVTRIIKAKRAIIDGSLKKQQIECNAQALELQESLNNWLRADSFYYIREKILEKVETTQPVRIIISAENYQLWQLPWQQWNLLERYSQAEMALSKLEYEKPLNEKILSSHNQVRILAILGDSQGIQVEQDQQQLINLPGAAVTFLVEPQRQELNEHLWQQHWDILFFAGHSQTEDKKGRIYLNQTDSLTLDELKYALQEAVARGLQLAIFNSCDGLGLACELEKLHIPQMIVMREPVPDVVAQTFLKYFLQAFANGKSLYMAVQEARKRLQGLEDEFLCASWLPVIYQNPAIKPLIWADLSQGAKEISLPRPQKPSLYNWKGLRNIFATSLVVTSLLMGVRVLGLLQSWELTSYDQLLRQRPPEQPDSRLLLVGADEEDIRKYKHPIPDATLAQVIAKIEQYQPVAIGLDIFRDQPVENGYESLRTQLEHNQHLIAVCAFGNSQLNVIAPPPISPIDQLGFNDLEHDHTDDTVRRQLLSRTANAISSFSGCKTPYSLSLQLTNKYMEAKGIAVETTSDKNWQFGKVIFRRLELHNGGYQNLDARGNQILINYRATPQIAQQVTFREILTGKFEPEWVKNRIVLIGVTAASIQDYHSTPYGKMRGLTIHAHMISQMLSAVENHRPLIWSLPLWGDTLWIWVWSCVGGVIVYLYKYSLILAPIAAFTILYSSCWLLLLQGAWLPLVPSALALAATSIIIYCVPFFTFKDVEK